MNDPKNGELPKFKIEDIKNIDFDISNLQKEDLKAMVDMLIKSSFLLFVKNKQYILYRNIIDIILVSTIIILIYFLK